MASEPIRDPVKDHLHTPENSGVHRHRLGCIGERCIGETSVKHRATWAWIAAIAGGAVLWLAAAGVSGKREAWDSSIYWTVAYPLGIGLAGGLGYWVPEKPWRWGLAVMLAQALVLFVSGSDFGLLPLGLIVFSILALPTVGVAAFMARFRLSSRKS